MCKSDGGSRTSWEGGYGCLELAQAHGGKQGSGVTLAHAALNGWVGAAGLAEGAKGDLREICAGR